MKFRFFSTALCLASLSLATPALGQADSTGDEGNEQPALPPRNPPLDTLGPAAPGEATQLPPGHPAVGGLPPGHPPVGDDQMDSKKLLEKLDAMRDQLKDRPKTAEIEYALGNLYYENGRYPEAIDYYRQLLERSAGALQRYLAARSHPHKSMTTEAAGCPSSEKPTFEKLIAIGDEKVGAKDFSAAVTCYEAALLPVVVAKARRANAFFLIGNPDRALQEHREVLAIEPDFTDSLFFLGAILFETGDGDVVKLKQASDAWKKFLATNPEPDRAKLVRENLARIDRALAAGGHLPTEPAPAPPLAGMGPGPIHPSAPPPELDAKRKRELQQATASGERLASKRDWAGSLAAFERARKIDLADPKAATGAGVALLNLGKRLEAEAAFRDALGRDPHDALALYELGEVFFQNQHFAGAARFWSQLLEEDPQTAEKLGVAARLAQAQAKQ